MKWIFSVATVALMLSGCATREYVHEYVQSQLKPVSNQVAALETRSDAAIKANAAGLEATDRKVSDIQVTLNLHADRIAKNEADIAQLSKTAQEAVERASAAGKLAEGKLVYEVVLSDDKLKFGPNKAALSKDAQEILDGFAAKLKEENKNVYIEIQGHTDSTGEAGPNLKLGEARAQAVKRYLNMKGGIPLHRMSVISYGESEPVADNRYKAGRKQNRRVVLVVIQ